MPSSRRCASTATATEDRGPERKAAPGRSARDRSRRTLIALEEAVWEDLAAGDSEAMRARRTDDFVLAGSHGFVSGADEWLAQMSGTMSEMESWSMDPPRVTVLSPTSVVLTYRNRATMGCDGQPMAESEGCSTTIWVQRDGEWKMAYCSTIEPG